MRLSSDGLTLVSKKMMKAWCLMSLHSQQLCVPLRTLRFLEFGSVILPAALGQFVLVTPKFGRI